MISARSSGSGWMGVGASAGLERPSDPSAVNESASVAGASKEITRSSAGRSPRNAATASKTAGRDTNTSLAPESPRMNFQSSGRCASYIGTSTAPRPAHA